MRLALGTFFWNESPSASIVKSVCKFNNQNSDVLGHRHNHLANSFGLRIFAELDLVELRDAVHQHRDLVTEVPL